MENDNQEMIERLKAGDAAAFGLIYTQYYRGLLAFASQYVERSDCEEIIQDVMLWLWENHAVLIPELSLRSLLFAVVKNRCLNKVAHLQMRQRVHERLYEKYKEVFEDPDFYIEGEILERIHQTISELPDDYREAFEMSRFDCLTYNEIAEQMGVSSKTVAYRISQSLKILRVELREYLLFLFLFL